MRKLFLILATLWLTACSNIPVQKILAGDFEAPDDTNMATWVVNAKYSVQLRLARLDQHPRTVAALKARCSQAVMSNVIVPLTQASLAQTFRGSCVRVFLSDNPDMTTSSTAALVDMDTLVVDGHLFAVGGPKVRHEYEIQQYLKETARAY